MTLTVDDWAQAMRRNPEVQAGVAIQFGTHTILILKLNPK